MNASRAKELKSIKTRERVYREIACSPKDLVTLRAFMVKKHLVDSGNKFDKAVEMLKTSGRVIVKGGLVMANPKDIKTGIFVVRGKSGYVLIDGDSRQFAIGRENSEGYNSNERVNIGFLENGDKKEPFIVSRQVEKEEKTFRDDVPLQDSSLVVGRVTKVSHDELVFIPNSKNFTKNVIILNAKKTLAKYQDKICVMKITENEKAGLPASGIITEIKGEAGNPIAEYDAIAESHGANMSWSGEALVKEIENIPSEVDLSGYTLVDESGKVIKAGGSQKIVDLRELGFATVDPATCKDMDDAIYSTYDDEGRLVVYTAVANVTKYVDLESEIGKKYIQGAFTVYAPNKAYNILPPELSTGICSLNPNVDRLALVIRSVIDEKSGLPIESTIMDAVINSKEKYSYEGAQKICDSNSDVRLDDLKKKIFAGEILTKDEQVILNSKVSDILWRGFNKRNLIKFDTKNEYDVEFNSDFSDILDINAQPHIPYHKVIESFMLTANEAAAEFTKKHGLPNIYRVHDEPSEDKLAQAHEFFGFLNIPFDGDLSPRGITKIVSSVKGTSKEKVVNNFLVRMQSKAKYNNSTNPKSAQFIKSESDFKGRKARAMATIKKNAEFLESLENMENISHFGLQSRHYSHTTSPIRRLPDYVTHKNILAYLNGEKLIDEKTVLEIAQWANEMQDANDQAEREFNEVNSAIYCEGHIGEVMRGKITGFKKLIDAGSVDINDIMVIVENEDKGIRVQIPASEVLPRGAKNVAISMFGSAIVNKSNSKPLVRLCEEVAFKITRANRITREAFASTDLEKELDNSSQEQIIDSGYLASDEKIVCNPALSAKRQRMLNNVVFNKAYVNSPEAQEEMFESRGRKHKGKVSSELGIEDVKGDEAYKTNKHASIKYRSRKQQSGGRNFMNDYDPDELDTD